MRAIHVFMLVTLAIAALLTTAHLAVAAICAVARHEVAQPVLLLPAPVDTPIEVEKFSAAAGAVWVAECRKVAARIVTERGTVTTDDVWAECPAPEGVDGRLIAQVFDRKEWEITGRVMSARGRNAARQIAVWRRKEKVAA